MELTLSVIGLLLTVVGLIALRPSLTVLPLLPVDPRQPFSVPFQITNTSFYRLRNVTVYGYMHRIRVGGLVAESNLQTGEQWKSVHLERGESITIITNFIHAPILPAEADIAIVVDYNAMTKGRHFARFVGSFGANWQWLRQPSKDVQAAAARMIDKQHQTWVQPPRG